MRSLGTDAIILKRRNLGEFDQSITLFSPMLGKIQATARGARKVSSQFAGHLEPLNICRLELHRSARNFTITQCQALKTFRPLRENLRKSMLSMLILEVFQKSTHTDEQGRELYCLIEETLDNISTGTKYPLIIEIFKIKLLQLLGTLPGTGHCSFCRRRWTPESIIALDHEGHFCCTECDNQLKPGEDIPFNIIRLINFICEHDFGKIMRIALAPKEHQSLRKISNSFLERFLDREIMAEKILDRI